LVEKPKTATGVMIFGQAGITAKDTSRYNLSVGNYSFGGEPLVSRLFRIVRSELGYTYAVGSGYQAMGGLSSQQGLYTIVTTPSIEYSGKTLFKSLELWKDYYENGLKEEELSLAHQSLVNSYPFEFDSSEKRLMKKLQEKLYGVPILSPEEFKTTVESIDNKKIISSLKEKQKSSDWLIIFVGESAVLEKQLNEEQSSVPADKRLKISKVFKPEQLIQ
jgi:zinc protease